MIRLSEVSIDDKYTFIKGGLYENKSKLNDLGVIIAIFPYWSIRIDGKCSKCGHAYSIKVASLSESDIISRTTEAVYR